MSTKQQPLVDELAEALAQITNDYESTVINIASDQYGDLELGKDETAMITKARAALARYDAERERRRFAESGEQ